MPKRKIQHQLEDLSRYKYGLAIPPQWVFRDKDKDYGIDGEVEIFNSKEEASGLVYWVQLKATKSKVESVIKSIDLSIDTINYYKRLDIPVLLVRYSSERDIFYIKWANEIDTFYAKENAKKMRIKFTDRDLWQPSTPTIIQEHLSKIKQLKSGHINLPIPIKISFNNDTINGKNKNILLPIFRKNLKSYKEFVKIEPLQNKALINIFIDESLLTVDLLGLTGCSFHSVDLMKKSTFEDDLVKDMMIGIATSLMNLGFNELAAQVIFTSGISDRVKIKHEIIEHLVIGMLKTNYFEQTLNLVSDVTDKIQNNFLELATSVAILHLSSDKNRGAIEFFLKTNIERYKNVDKKLYGIALYNLGNFYRKNHFDKSAIKCFLKARRYEVDYDKRDYFWGELAGALFDIKKFKLSSSFYKRALEINGEEKYLALYGDALMFSGNYKESLNIFNKYLSKNHQSSPEWHLKALCLEDAIQSFEIENQSRKVDSAIKLTSIENISDKSAEKKLEKALKLDLLCGNAWFNLGIIHSKRNKFEMSSFCFTLSALVQSWDLEAWVNATIISFNKEVSLNIFILIVKSANFYHGDEYLTELYIQFNNRLDEDALSSISEVVEKIVQSEKRKEIKPQIRLIDEFGAYTSSFN
jgi:tetratricopeptide (TPR) repeat protein